MSPEIETRACAGTSLADYTRPELIVPCLRERDATGIIGELSHVLQRQECVPDVLPFLQAALNQELLFNSATECGIAFPHGRLGAVKQLQFAFGRTREPIIWGANSACPIQLVFLLAVPATDAASYLHLLSSLAKLGQYPETLNALRRADSPRAVLSLFEKVKIRGR